MNIGNWIRASREAATLKQDQLAERLGKSRGNVSAWENGRHEPSFAQILEIARITGHAVPIPGLDGGGLGPPASAPGPGARHVPLVGGAQAARMTEAADPFSGGNAHGYLPTDQALSGHAFALEIDGLSMAPEFMPGDRIIVDPATSPRPGDYVVAKNRGGDTTFRKYRARGADANGRDLFELVPLNPDYPTVHSEHAPVRVIGVMVEHRRYRQR